MTPDRVTRLIQLCHDRKIKLETAQQCGKVLVHSSYISGLYQILEEVLAHVEYSRKSVI